MHGFAAELSCFLEAKIGVVVLMLQWQSLKLAAKVATLLYWTQTGWGYFHWVLPASDPSSGTKNYPNCCKQSHATLLSASQKFQHKKEWEIHRSEQNR